MVIYNIKCTQNNAEYNGKTDVILSIRFSEHKMSEYSACFQHSRTCNGLCKVTDTASTDTKLRVKELLHILKREPLLNKQFHL